VPTTPWRSAMSVPRFLTLRQTADGLVLVQKPISLASLRGETLFNGSTQINDSSPLRISLEHDSSFEFETTVSANAKQQLNIDIRNWNGEKVTIGYNWDKQQLFIDRGDTRGFENPYFTNDFSSFLAPPNGQFKLHALVDRSIVELYVNDGERVATTVFFMEKPASELVFGAKNGSVAVQDLRVLFTEKYLAITINSFLIFSFRMNPE
jgi:fructan beta-fructosidase